MVMSRRKVREDYDSLISTTSELTLKNTKSFSTQTDMKVKYQKNECYICHDNSAS